MLLLRSYSTTGQRTDIVALTTPLCLISFRSSSRTEYLVTDRGSSRFVCVRQSYELTDSPAVDLETSMLQASGYSQIWSDLKMLPSTALVAARSISKSLAMMTGLPPARPTVEQEEAPVTWSRRGLFRALDSAGDDRENSFRKEASDKHFTIGDGDVNVWENYGKARLCRGFENTGIR